MTTRIKGSNISSGTKLTSPVLDTGVTGSAIKDEDDMISDSSAHLATQQSIKAYVIANQVSVSLLDEDNMISDSPSSGATQQSIKAFVEGQIIDEDDMISDSATKAPSQQSVRAYVATSGGSINDSTLSTDLTLDAGKNQVVVGPVTIPNVTANGHLNVIQSLNVTGDLTIGANGSLNIVG